MEPIQGELTNKRRIFVSTDLAGGRETRSALLVVLGSFVFFLAAVPFAKTQLAQVPAFIPIYESTLVICDLIECRSMIDPLAQERGISGIQAMRILAQDPVTAHIPVIAISANAIPRDIESAFKTGFFRYLTKPIKMQELIDVLDMALTSSEIRLNDPWRREVTTSG